MRIACGREFDSPRLHQFFLKSKKPPKGWLFAFHNSWSRRRHDLIRHGVRLKSQEAIFERGGSRVAIATRPGWPQHPPRLPPFQMPILWGGIPQKELTTFSIKLRLYLHGEVTLETSLSFCANDFASRMLLLAGGTCQDNFESTDFA